MDDYDAAPKMSMDLFSDLGLDFDEPLSTFTQSTAPPKAPATKRQIQPSSDYQPAHLTSSSSRAQQMTSTPSKPVASLQFQWEGFDQVRELQEQNTAILRQLDEKERELAEAKGLLEDSRRAQQRGELSAPVPDAGQKISQLSKKVRELTASFNAEQARANKLGDINRQLEGNIGTLSDEIDRLKRKEKKLEARIARLEETKGQNESEPTSSKPDVKSKAEPEKAETYALRSQIQTLKKDLQLAHRALSKEIGDDVPVAQVLSSESSWKGRAEQIALLKMRLAELQASSTYNDISIDGTFKSASTSMTSTTKEADRRYKAELKKTEQERRQALERTQEEFQLAKQENAQLKQKLEGVKARVQSLSQEVKEFRDKYETSTQQLKKQEHQFAVLKADLERLRSTGEDWEQVRAQLMQDKEQLEELCGAQHSALASLQQQIDESEKQKKGLRRQHEKELEQMHRELNEIQRSAGEGLGAQLAAQQDQIHRLQQQLSQQNALIAQQQQQLQQQQQQQLPPVKPPSRASSTSKPTTAISSSSRLGSAQTRPVPESKDIQMQLQEAMSAFRAADMERTKQAELIALLKKQGLEATSKIEMLDAQLRMQRSSCARMEKDLALFMLKNPEVPDMRELHELQSKLAIIEDENQALKESTKASVRRKDEEIQLLNSMIFEIKRIYADSLKSLKQMVASSAESESGSKMQPRPPSRSKAPK